MVKIKKGSTILKVSKGSYEDTFKKLGYEILNETEEVAQKTTSSEKIIEDKKLIEEEIKNNKQKEENVVKSDDLNVNVIGENIKDFGKIKEEQEEIKNNEQKENSLLEKVLQEKENKSKRK